MGRANRAPRHSPEPWMMMHSSFWHGGHQFAKNNWTVQGPFRFQRSFPGPCRDRHSEHDRAGLSSYRYNVVGPRRPSAASTLIRPGFSLLTAHCRQSCIQPQIPRSPSLLALDSCGRRASSHAHSPLQNSAQLPVLRFVFGPASQSLPSEWLPPCRAYLFSKPSRNMMKPPLPSCMACLAAPSHMANCSMM